MRRSKEDIKLAVKKGAYWLDEVYPEWEGMVDLEALDLQSSRCCVLGQIEVSAGRLWSGYTSVLVKHCLSNEFAVDHGFNKADDAGETYAQLTEAWIEFIGERRGQEE